jgi:hypothetical protein
MKFRIFIPALLVMIFLIAACAPPINLRNEKFLRDEALLTTDGDCTAPCWRNITPGTTPWEDALAVLQKDTDFTEVKTQKAESGPAIAATWQQKEGDPCCQMVSEDGKNVSFILLQLAPKITVGKIIETRKEPKYVIGSPGSEDQAVIYLFYPDESLIVIAFVAGAKSGKLSASSEVVGAWYLAPDRMDLILKTNSLHAWKGYETFSTYAPDTPASQFAITPSVTLTPTPAQ